MNNFQQGDPVFVDRFKEFGVIEYVERNKVIVLLINQKTIQIQPFECAKKRFRYNRLNANCWNPMKLNWIAPNVMEPESLT
jgi:hypothetical protein